MTSELQESGTADPYTLLPPPAYPHAPEYPYTSSVPSLPQKNWFARHKLLSIVAGLFVLGAIGSAIGSSPTTGSDAQPNTPAASLDSGSTGSSVSSGKAALVTWAYTNEPKISAISDDLRAVTAAAQAYDLSRLEGACSVLVSDVASFEATGLPAPDADLNTETGLAMEAYKKAGNECASGELEAAAADISAGTPHINAATARIGILNGG